MRALHCGAMYRLHCFGQSGNAFKVAFMLRALGVPYENVFVDYFGGVTRAAAWREGVNEMGEIPVLDDGERRLTQSGAILMHLAAKHGRFGGESEEERHEVLRWILFDNHKFTSYFATYRFMKSFGPTAPCTSTGEATGPASASATAGKADAGDGDAPRLGGVCAA